MTTARMIGTIAAAFLLSQVFAILIHGFILAADYAPYYGTLLRGDDGPSWQMIFLPVAHLSFIAALVWVWSRMRLSGPPLRQGLVLGVVGWALGQAPLWLIWYAEQPWPDSLIVKQLGWELASSLLIGLTIVFVSGMARQSGAQRAMSV